MVRIVGDRMLSKYWHFYILNLKTLHKNKKFPVLVPWHLLSIDQVRFLAGNQLNELKCHRHGCWGRRWCPKKTIAIFINKQNSKSCPQDQYKNLTCNMRHVKCDMWEHDKQSLLRIPGSQLFFHNNVHKKYFFLTIVIIFKGSVDPMKNPKEVEMFRDVCRRVQVKHSVQLSILVSAGEPHSRPEGIGVWLRKDNKVGK